MSCLIVKRASVVCRDRVLEDHSLVCENGLITEIVPARLLDDGNPARAAIVDGHGMYLVPGFIDLHIHGLKGKLADRGRTDLEFMSRELPRFGVTGFLPALTPGENELELLADLAGAKPFGAEVLAFFLEGHFLKLTGAIRGLKAEYTAARVEALKKALAPNVAVFGISPEIPDILSLLPMMCEGGVPAFITHTMANYEQTEKAIEAGAKHATHFYDVFPYPGEQEPGVRGCGAVEAVLAGRETTVDFILDGEHVHPGAVKMALACKGMNRVCLVTDANINAGLEPGVYKGISGTDIVMEYPGGPAREYCGSDYKAGGLVGSGLTMDLAFKNAVKMLGLSLPEAAALTSTNPAGVLGLGHERGVIEKGFCADFALLDREFSVKACYASGIEVYKDIPQ